MSETSKKITLDVIKRNGRKVDFDASKIAIAIKKGFDDVNKLLESSEEQSDSNKTYTSKDVNKV